MNRSKAASVCSPRASASNMSLSAASISVTRAMSCGVAFSNACFMPRNWLSSTSRRSRSEIFSKVSRACGERHS
ncbi:hypothetical protein FrCorBMG51_00830 [Protofrankia coriariae]|uniref:Secreted protein n=1 Tax=Protofrankia coriariae TaxID=1562887 RepID=A0ABR5F8P5_9ACTN|nr:hypothetical protein FrCorBMG51_00830 [Protofrankia coriariae]